MTVGVRVMAKSKTHAKRKVCRWLIDQESEPGVDGFVGVRTEEEQ